MKPRKGSSRRTFLSSSAAIGSAMAAGMSFVPNAHARGADVIKVGLVGCGGRGTGAAENICEAAGTSFNIKLHAMADVFKERVDNVHKSLSENEKCQGKIDVPEDRRFVGFDAFEKVIDCCDLVILATPPGFRPSHIEAVIKSGRNLFTEKPVAVDPAGIRKVMAAAEEAKSKNLAVVAGTQRRHQGGYLQSMQQIHDGVLGDLHLARVFWNQGNIWAYKRQEGWSDMEYQLRNWYHFTWLCGDHIVEQHVHNLDVANWAFGAHPIKCRGMGGQQVNRGEEFGESYDHFAVSYEYPDQKYVISTCRQIANCDNDVSETVYGSKGYWQSNGYRFSNGERLRVRNEVNPYVQEHIDLLTSIKDGKPLNELQQVAESTLTAIMGRLSAYTGRDITWEEALNANLDTFPKNLEWGDLPVPSVAMPGQYELA